MKNIAGKVAFVTGAASGIGLSLTKALLNAGMNVVMADVQQDKLEQASNELEVAKERIQQIVLDVSDSEAVEQAAKQVGERFGTVHLICNIAGVAAGTNPVSKASVQEWRWVLGVNVEGPVNVVRSFLPMLLANDEGGHIVNMASMAAFIPTPVPGGLYTTTKFALRGFTEALRLELGQSKVDITGVYPALVNTHFDLNTAALAPEAVASDMQTPPEGTPDFLRDFGISPDIVAELIIDGVKNNAPHVFTHGELKPVLAGIFSELLVAFPEADPDALAKLTETNRLMSEMMSQPSVDT